MAAITVQRRGVHVFRVRPVELATAALVGLLLPGANAILFVAERHVPTGVSSLIIGSVPLWVVLLRTAAADRPPTRSLIGVGIGFAGLALLVRPSGGAPLWAMLIVVCSAMTWTTGIGALLVLACVALVVRTEAIPPEAEAIGAGAAELELTRQ